MKSIWAEKNLLQLISTLTSWFSDLEKALEKLLAKTKMLEYTVVLSLKVNTGVMSGSARGAA